MGQSDPPAGPGLEAFNAVYQRELDYVWRTLGRLGVPDADLPDAAHDVFVVLYRRWSDIDPGLPIRAWLFGVARKIAAARRRARKPTDSLPDIVDDGTNERIASRDLLWRALAELDEARRVVVVLHDLEGHTGIEIANMLGISANTVHSRLRLARAELVDVITRMRGTSVPGVVTRMFVSMRSGASGTELWHAELDAPPMDMMAHAAAFDSAGNVIIAGEARHGVVASDSTFGEGDMFVAKYDAAGALLWRHGLRDGSGASATTIALGSDGTVYVGGDFRGAIDVGSGPLANTPPLWTNGSFNYDAFLAAFDPSGALRWTRVFQGPGQQKVLNLTTASEGQLSFVGSTLYGGASFGGPAYQPTLRFVHAFVTYTTDGDYLWSEPIAPVQFDEFSALAVRYEQDRFVALGHGFVGDEAVEGTLVADENGVVESASELTDQLLMSAVSVNEAGMFVLGDVPSDGSANTSDVILSARDSDGELLGQLDVTGLRPPQASVGNISIQDLAISGETVIATGPLQYGADFGTGLIQDHGSSLDANGMWNPGMGDTFVVAYDWVAD